MTNAAFDSKAPFAKISLQQMFHRFASGVVPVAIQVQPESKPHFETVGSQRVDESFR